MKRRLLVLAASCLGGLLVGAAWPPPPIPPARIADNAWRLPSATQIARSNPDAFEQAGRLAWLGDGSAASDVQTDAKWRLAGVVRTPDLHALVITPASPRLAQRLAPGATLPDGGRVVAIERDMVTIERNGCQTVYQVHRDQPIRTSGACNTGAPDSE
ncbi:hypothetical protein [Luteimonas deserti]|uniref:Pilus assembly protein PilP n=1 Tax=Luteimonas deserti TaxID=2752306 RepID=A0A7Z0TZH6_9GAMM|nr:hypothetical protein [Luteimonas deserti]NYZ62243.1 hypothetical protein [Luteimonas deserti]